MSQEKNFVSIQVLRGVAALMVAVAHCYAWIAGAGEGATDTLPYFIGGAFGVDLFFVISGFVMVYSSEQLFGRADAPWQFISRRIVRIVPLYAAVTILSVIFIEPATLPHVAASLLFWPWPPTGIPVLGVGWTLNVEMMFYAAFAVALFSRNRVATISATSGFLVLTTFLPPSHPEGSALGNPIVIELIFGMLIGLLYRRGTRIPVAAAAGLVGAAVLAYAALTPAIVLWSTALPPGHHWAVPRAIAWGLPATAIIAAATLTNTGLMRPRVAGIASMQFLGDISYALYLLHNLVYAVIAGAVTALEIDVARYAVPLAAVMLACAIAAASAAHLGFEKPSLRWLRARLRRGTPASRDLTKRRA